MIIRSRNLVYSFWPVLAIILIGACQSQVQKPEHSFSNMFSDPILIQIHDLKDTRNGKQLLSFFDHTNPTYRAEAAAAFGSVQDVSAIPMLGHMLNDSSPKVRKAAAYALGQTFDSSSVNHLIEALRHEDSLFVRKELLEALGKVITQPKIALLYTQNTPTQQEKEGLAWGLYRAGIRNVHDSATVELAISLLASGNSYESRLASAHFVAGTKNIDLTKFEHQLITCATEDPAANVRLAAIEALKKVPSAEVLTTLIATISKDSDSRIRISALQALGAFEYSNVKDAAFQVLQDSNSNVAIAAAELIGQLATSASAQLIRNTADEHQFLRVKALLLGTALRISPDKQSLIDHITQLYAKSNDPYFKADLLIALSNSLKSYNFLINETFSANHPAIKTAGINSLVVLWQQQNVPENLKPQFYNSFKRALLTGDIAMISVVANFLGNPAYKFQGEYKNFDFLYHARNMLALPKDNEALQALNRTIAYFEGKDELPETINAYNNPIEWELVKNIPRNQQVKLKTSRGEVILRLLVDSAPGTVSNFVQLAKSGYFDGKNFHRVVPNFVVQGGCNRGDGYGGENYSIRSEFAHHKYQTGSVGMASAGKDTEGTQWFITHRPTPHLDGRYTIFAQVTDGMEVVQNIQVGDKILSIEFL